jgi:hypothetical protein
VVKICGPESVMLYRADSIHYPTIVVVCLGGEEGVAIAKKREVFLGSSFFIKLNYS